VTGSRIEEEDVSFILGHWINRTILLWRAFLTLLSRLGCALSISKVPSHEHEVRLQSHAIVPLRQASRYHSTVIIRSSVHSPCLIKKLARTSPANASFIAVGFLGKGSACMVLHDSGGQLRA
jgi:hypothetical protein